DGGPPLPPSGRAWTTVFGLGLWTATFTSPAGTPRTTYEPSGRMSPWTGTPVWPCMMTQPKTTGRPRWGTLAFASPPPPAQPDARRTDRARAVPPSNRREGTRMGFSCEREGAGASEVGDDLAAVAGGQGADHGGAAVGDGPDGTVAEEEVGA